MDVFGSFSLLLAFVCAVYAFIGGIFAIPRGIPDVSDLAPHRSKLDQLLEGRDMLYDNLRDLKFDFRAGKYSEADYESMKTALESQAAIVLTRIDEVTEAQIRRPRVVRASMGEPAAASRRSGK